MKVELTNNEIMALIKLKNMLEKANTPTSLFLKWIAERLVLHGDSQKADFIQKLHEYADEIREISHLLGVDR